MPKFAIPKIPAIVVNPSPILRTFDVSAALKTTMNQAGEILSRIQVNPIQEVIQASAKQASLTEAVGRLASQQAKLAKTIQLSLGDGFQKYLEQLGKQVAEAARLSVQELEGLVLADPMTIIAAEFGWPPLKAPDEFTAYLLKEALQIDDDQLRQEFVDGEVMEYFQGQRLDELFWGWQKKPYLKDTERLVIIESAFEAYKDMNYSLASPALLPQIEGLYCEQIIGEEVLISEKHYEEQMDRLKDEAGVDYYPEASQTEVLFEFVQQHGFFGFKDEKNPNKNPISQDISRHKILHGSSTAYCRRQDITLRHILWLDCVFDMIELTALIKRERAEDG